MNFSTKTSEMPNAAPASDCARLNASSSSPGAATILIPRPPPPPTAFTSMAEPEASPARKSRACAIPTASEMPGTTGTLEFLSQSASAGLVPEEFERRGAGADEDEALALAAARERRVLAEEPVSGVNRVATRPARQCNDLFRVQVGARSLAVQRLRRVGAAHVQGTAVVPGIDGHGLDAAIRGRGRNPDCDPRPRLAMSNFLTWRSPPAAWAWCRSRPSRSSSSISASSRPRIPPSNLAVVLSEGRRRPVDSHGLPVDSIRSAGMRQLARVLAVDELPESSRLQVGIAPKCRVEERRAHLSNEVEAVFGSSYGFRPL